MVKLILIGLQFNFSQSLNLLLKDTEKNVSLSLPPPPFSLLVLISLINRFLFYFCSHIKNSICKIKLQILQKEFDIYDMSIFFYRFFNYKNFYKRRYVRLTSYPIEEKLVRNQFDISSEKNKIIGGFYECRS